MSKHWKEKRPIYLWKNKFTPVWCYRVQVCGFTFSFFSINEMIETKKWFEKKIHKSTRAPDSPWLKSERDVAQKWYERLPAKIKKGSKRRRVVQALEQAINEYS